MLVFLSICLLSLSINFLSGCCIGFFCSWTFNLRKSVRPGANLIGIARILELKFSLGCDASFEYNKNAFIQDENFKVPILCNLNATNAIDWVVVKMSTTQNYGEIINKVVLVII